MALVFASAGCSDSNSVIAASSGFATGEVVVDMDFLNMIHTAPFRESFVGERTVSFTDTDHHGVQQQLLYSELVAADGQGKISIDPLSIQEPELDPDRFEVFRMVQQSREKFFFNHRDFRIRNLELFRDNYTVRVVNAENRVADRLCVQLEVLGRSRSDGNSSLVDVDLETGLIMRAREFNSANRLVSDVCYESIAFGEVDPRRFDDDESVSVVSRSLEKGEELNLAIGAPAMPPRGFQLLEERIVTDPLGDEWHELIYGDGSEQIFLFYKLSETGLTEVLPDDEVGIFRMGAWMVAEGSLRGQKVLVLGKLSRSEILTTLESCLN